jgi:prolyl oligopeptidase
MNLNKFSYTAMAAIIFSACSNNNSSEKAMSFTYPETKKDTVVDTYFGTEVIDPYRWLEDDMSAETEDWVKRQNEFTFAYLNTIPYKDSIKNRLSQLWNYEKLTSPFKEGGATYFYKNDGLQNQFVMYREVEGEEAQIFLDPNTFSADGTTSLGGVEFTKDGSLVAYSISEGGSDWRKVIVMDVNTKTIIEDTLKDVKFSGISWKDNDGFYYSSYDKPKGSELSAKTDQHKLYYHKLGTKQKEDKLIFGGTAEQKRRYVGGSVTEDGRYLIISGSVSTSGNELYIKDLSKANSPIVPMITGFDSDSYVMDNDGDKLFIVTNLNAPNKKIVTVDAKNPASENWVDVIAEKEYVLSPNTGGGYIFAHYMVDAISKVEQYDYSGKLIRTVDLPGVGTASGFGSKREEKELYYSFTNYNTPGSIYKLNVEDGKSELYWSPKIDFNPADYESKQIFYYIKRWHKSTDDYHLQKRIENGW